MLETIFRLFTNLSKSVFTFFKILFRSKIISTKKHSFNPNIFILGNGPSLNQHLKEYSDFLKNELTLCVNKFPDTNYFTLIKPSYFIFTAAGYFKPEKIKYEQDTRDNIINALIQKTSWPLTFFCPAQARSNPAFINRIIANKYITIQYFNTTPIEGLKSINHFFFRHNLGSPRPHNVLIPSILMMINSGIKNIYLLGADHSWLPLISVDDENNALINQQHFYDQKTSTSGQMYRNSKPRRLHEILEKFMLSFRAYFELKEYADTRGTKIYNCTPNSYIDAFERKSISDILAKDHVD